MMQLRLDPPMVDEAEKNLAQAAEELIWCSAGPVEIARNDLAIARARFLKGDIGSAQTMSSQIHETVQAHAPFVAADAKSLEGQAFAAAGQIDEAVKSYREAVLVLTSIGSDRGAAQLWFELAGLLEEVGDLDAARDAYKSAAASAGLRSRPTVRLNQQV
jgi:tetratricopeptide (TPR) repeat protein